jgi:HSP20 family protein
MKKIFKKLSGLDKNPVVEADEDEQEDELDYYENDEEIEDENEEEEEDEEEESEDEEEEEDVDDEEGAWLQQDYEEGQLSIDVFQTPTNLIVKSTIAGVRPEDIDISINNDMLTIRGKREQQEEIKEKDYLYRECYWGSFSRSIILPVEIESDKIEATLENGVLSIILPKAKPTKQISIKVKER